MEPCLPGPLGAQQSWGAVSAWPRDTPVGAKEEPQVLEAHEVGSLGKPRGEGDPEGLLLLCGPTRTSLLKTQPLANTGKGDP